MSKKPKYSTSYRLLLMKPNGEMIGNYGPFKSKGEATIIGRLSIRDGHLERPGYNLFGGLAYVTENIGSNIFTIEDDATFIKEFSDLFCSFFKTYACSFSPESILVLREINKDVTRHFGHSAKFEVIRTKD